MKRLSWNLTAIDCFFLVIGAAFAIFAAAHTQTVGELQKVQHAQHATVAMLDGTRAVLLDSVGAVADSVAALRSLAARPVVRHIHAAPVPAAIRRIYLPATASAARAAPDSLPAQLATLRTQLQAVYARLDSVRLDVAALHNRDTTHAPPRIKEGTPLPAYKNRHHKTRYHKTQKARNRD